MPMDSVQLLQWDQMGNGVLMPRPKPNDGLTNEARYRARHPERCRESVKKWLAKNPDWSKKEYRKLRDRHRAPLLKKQKGKCAICKRKMKYPQRDHDHSCCPIGTRGGCDRCRRGLLCCGCNGSLHLVENKRLLKAAIAYLKRWEKTQWKIKNT